MASKSLETHSQAADHMGNARMRSEISLQTACANLELYYKASETALEPTGANLLSEKAAAIATIVPQCLRQ